MDRVIFLFFFTLISILLDFYFFQIFKKYITNKWFKILNYIYWSISSITFLNFVFNILDINLGYFIKTLIFNIVIGNFISKVVALPFLLIDDLRRFSKRLFSRKSISKENTIPRSKFLSISASLAYGIPITSLTYGIISNNVYDYRVKRRVVSFDNLPKEFDGIRVCHISDIHVGSLRNRLAVKGGIDMILNEKADLIFFTGDLVNNKSDELKGWGDDLSKIKAPLGVYSVLGNHDYGEYTSWKSNEEKNRNFKNLLKAQKEFGWNLLLNENDTISVDGNKIKVIGVENWGSGFKKAGDLNKALNKVSEKDFKILLTHDPSHWEAQVIPHPFKIHLTLSGHTHGMQFGIEIPGIIKWSPAKWRYKQWAGVYGENKQYLNVNRGFGYLAYPGRVGMWPEVSVITLSKSKSSI